MDLNVIAQLKETFGDRYISSNELFRRSLNEVAVPAMGCIKATLWLIVDTDRGEDVVRRHYETMLACDTEATGVERNIDPYKGPSELASRLRQQGFNIEMTCLPADYEKKLEYIAVKRRSFLNADHDIQAVCYNLDPVAIVDEPSLPEESK